jgi:hypothetical protein
MIAPVLPGETMKKMMLQTRAVSDPIQNPFIGWWLEYYVFYVKLRDLDDRDTLTGIFTDASADLSSLNSAAHVNTFHYGGAPNFVDLCLDRVVDEYFRDEGEAINDATTGLSVAGGTSETMPMATARVGENWAESLKLESDTGTGDQLPGEASDGNRDETVMSGYETHYAQWEFMRANNLTDASYEDYLRTYGVTVPEQGAAEDEHKPELIRYVRDWKYPVNTINPANGAPSSAVSWVLSERADKARLFKEPGFIFAVQVARPKIYFSGQAGNAAAMLDSAFPWLPAVLSDEPYTSLREFATATGPVPGIGSDYWVDVRDLFLYGDQLFNFDIAAAGDCNAVALPSSTAQKRYASSADINKLFVDSDGSGGANLVRSDGRFDLTIAGRQVDTT